MAVNYLLDTCVISELSKKNPNQGLVSWIIKQENHALFISSITLGEIQKGISKLPESSRKNDLMHWLERDVIERFSGKTIAVAEHEALSWGRVQASTESSGKPMPIVDSIIAATALYRNMVLVTRNTKNVEASGVKLLNPWS